MNEARVIDEDFDNEPIPGLPEELPPGERVLWSAAPDWRAVALDVFHVRAVALYAGLLLAWRMLTTLYDGGTALQALASAAVLAGVFAAGLGLLTVLAICTARTTRYTITNHRVVFRIGVALTMSINLPFKQMVAADYRPAPFGTGAIALHLSQSGGLGYLVLWPHVRPFKFSKPQPMMRGIKDGERVARILSSALAAEHGGTKAEVHVKAPPAARHPVAA